MDPMSAETFAVDTCVNEAVVPVSVVNDALVATIEAIVAVVAVIVPAVSAVMAAFEDERAVT